MRRAAFAALALLLAAPAAAQDADRFCPNRPSLGASGCTTQPGHLQLELSGIDWQRDDQDGQRIDTLLYGDVQARIGVDARSELQLGWTPLASVRTRDAATGAVSRVTGVGDVTIAFRRSISHPDGKALSMAIQPFAVLPTGRDGIGDGTWSAGLTLPALYQVDDHWSLEGTVEGSARADRDGHGRHRNVNAVAGIGYAITDSVNLVGEFYAERDEDPAQPATIALLAGSVAWQRTPHSQLDLLATVGLNHDSPDLRVVIGGAALF